jgi:hypothetical protein
MLQPRNAEPTRLSKLTQKVMMVQSLVRGFLPEVAPAPGSSVPAVDPKVLVLALQACTVVPRLTVVKAGGALREPSLEEGGKLPCVKLRLGSTNPSREATADLTIANESLTEAVFQLTTVAPFVVVPKPSATALKHPLSADDQLKHQQHPQHQQQTVRRSSITLAAAAAAGGATAALVADSWRDRVPAVTATGWFKLQPLANLEVTIHYHWRGPSAAAGTVPLPLLRPSEAALIAGGAGAAVAHAAAAAAAAAAAPPPPLVEEESSSLWVKYANGDSQEILLKGVVQRPAVEVGLSRGAQPARYDYGLLSAGVDADGDGRADALVADSDANVTTLYLGNITPVAAVWSLHHVPGGAAADGDAAAAADGVVLDDPSAFAFAATGGTQEGPTVPVASGLVWNKLPDGVHDEQKGMLPRALRVHFRPQREARYCSKFRIDVEGGIGTTFTLLGSGTFEETFSTS